MKKKYLTLGLALTATVALFSFTSCSLIKHFQDVANSEQSGDIQKPAEADQNRIGLTLSADRQVLQLDDETEGFAQLSPAYDQEEVSKIAAYLKTDTVEFTYQWKSSDTTVAKVDRNGRVKATGKGDVTISVTAKIKGKTGIAGVASFDFSVGADEDYATISRGNSGFAGNNIVVNNPGKWYFYCDQSSVINSMAAYYNRGAAHVAFEEIAEQKEWYLRYQPQGVTAGQNYALSFTLNMDRDGYIRYGGPKNYRYIEYYTAGKHQVTLDNLYFDGTTPFSVCVLSDYPEGVDDKSEFKDKIAGGTFSFSIGDVRVEEKTLSISAQTASINLTKSTNTVTLTATNTLDGESFTWSSSDDSIATVENGVVTGVGSGTAVITATLPNGRHVSCRVTVIAESIVMDRSTDVIDLDGQDLTLQLAVTYTSVGGEQKPIVWSSSNTNVVTVNDSGLVTAVGEGAAVITATCGAVSATCNITVAHSPMKFGNNTAAINNPGEWFYYYDTSAIKSNPVTVAQYDEETNAVTLSMNTASKTVQVKYQPTYAVGETYALTFTVTIPEGAAFESFKYGKDGATKNGLADVNAGTHTFTYVGTVSDTKPFIISYKVNKTGDVVISDISVSQPTTISKTSLALDLYNNATGELIVKNYDGTIVWESSDRTVVSVESGVVTALKTGKATVTATLQDGTELTCEVTVTDSTPVTVQLSQNTANIDLYTDEHTLTLTATASDGSAVVWSSSAENIATVENGVVTLLATGTVTITATSGAASDSCVITVTDSTPDAITVQLSQNTANVDLYNDGNTLTLTATTSDGSAVVWSSSAESIATVENGVVTLLATGTVTVTATSGTASDSCVITVTDSTPQEESYGIEVRSAGGNGAFGTARKKFVEDAVTDTWAMIVNGSTAKGYVSDAQYANGTISFAFNSGSSTVAKSDNGKVYLCYMPADATKTYNLSYTVSVEGGETSAYSVSKETDISAGQPIYIYISNLASTGCTVTISDISVTEA